MYRIQHKYDHNSWWKSADGWSDKSVATIFTEYEKQRYPTPPDGEWIACEPWIRSV